MNVRSNVILLIPRHHNIHAILQRPKLPRNTLPCIPPHYDRVHLACRCSLDSGTSKVGHFLGKLQRKASVLVESVCSSCGDNHLLKSKEAISGVESTLVPLCSRGNRQESEKSSTYLSHSMANVGIEPKTFALLARRSNQLS